MADLFHFLDEPQLSFGDGQIAQDPHDGLALFGPSERRSALPDHVVMGTPSGVQRWREWAQALNAPASCLDATRQRPWPPYPGFDVAFGVPWPMPAREYKIDAVQLHEAAHKSDRHERTYAVTNMYVAPIERISKLDAKPALVVCVVPDEVYENCRPKSSVKNASDTPRTIDQRAFLRRALKDHDVGQTRMFDGEDETYSAIPDDFIQYGLSPDFRRQLKGRMMAYDLPVQIVRESTLVIIEKLRRGEKGENPLSDRLWNIGTALFYKCGLKPWKTPWAREGVCYVGLAYRKDDRDKRAACCAAQMFLDSGDGIVFVGGFGPWYSEESREFHLTTQAAEKLLRGTIETYQNLDGRPLTEIFLHARSGIDAHEYQGFLKACPPWCETRGNPRAPR